METFSALLAICAGNSPASGEFPAQRPVTRRFDVFFGLCLNKRLRKQSWGWWFETLSRPLWRHCNEYHAGPPLSNAIIQALCQLFALCCILLLWYLQNLLAQLSVTSLELCQSSRKPWEILVNASHEHIKMWRYKHNQTYRHTSD